MAQPPRHDPNDPAARHATAGHHTSPEEKKSKVIPIVIGIVALLAIVFFIVPMFSGDNEVETVEETAVPDTATAPMVTEDEPVAPATDTTPPEQAATDAPAPVDDTAAPAIPTPEANADVDGQESITVDIEEPTDAPAPAPAPVEGQTETTTVPLQEPATTPAN